ncbi:MAG: C1 family peptidase [Trueperaceae bacterium]|nr:C1 family peptidase [Trueperaceae bacterium]
MKLAKFLILILILSACATPPTPDPGKDLFTEDNAWTGEIPADAETVTPEEFQKGIDSGEFVLVSSKSLAAEKQARQESYNQNISFLTDLGSKDPATVALLKEAETLPDFQTDLVTQLPGGQSVTLFGLGTQIDNATAANKLAQSVDNALADYTQTYALLPEALKSQAPRPESLEGKALADVQAALEQLNTLLGTLSSTQLDGLRLESNPQLPSQAVNPGNGTDNNGACTPTNYAGRYWFPLKNFISPVKNQANRGTCWAFTAIGALESRERVQNNNPANLSEQFLINKVKEDWDSDDDNDGYWSEKALNTAVSKGQVFPSENGWTYNPSMSRPADSYANSCNGYSGDCSDTSHQSKRVCTTFIFTFCSYQTVNYSGPGVAASTSIQIWKNGDAFDLNRYRFLLSQGYVIMASFPVYKGFMDDVTNNGVVSNYAKTRLDDKGKEVDGSYGGHALQIVGFLSNDELSQFGNTPKIGGGGYFIIKNSWGCNAGDAGFYYVPADYVSQIFNSLSVLNFDGRRSDAWNKEQAAPGGTNAPKIQIITNPARVDLRVKTDLAKFFNVSHPVAKSVTLSVSSDKDGSLYSGPWSTDTNLLFGPSLERSFATAGTRTLSLTAKYGSSQSSASFAVNVVNTAPTITLDFSGEARQSEPYTITTLILDPNESDVNKLCATTTWSVDAPDTLSATTGCQIKVTFGTTGIRQIRVSTKDSDGAAASKTLELTVLPPAENPYPKIVSAGVYSREFITTGLIYCGTKTVATGNTIDLREKGCKISSTLPDPQRYFAEVKVENPSGETLTNSWELYVTYSGAEHLLYSSSDDLFSLYPYGNAYLGTDDCRIAVTVNAPEASRSKSQTVWTGKCTYYAGVLN